MDFFNGLGKTLEEAARQVGEKSEEIWEAGRLNIEIFKREDAIRRIYRKIGEQVSADYEKGERFGSGVNEYCDEIQERKSEISRLKARLSETGKSEKQSGKQPEQQPFDYQASGPKQQESSKTSGNAPKEHEISYFEAVEKMQKNEQNQ